MFWALAILLYLPGLGTPRLNEAEAIVATIASQEHFTTVDPVITAADDAVIGVYPLQPFLVRLLSLPLGRVTAWTVRLPSLVAIIVLAWAAGRAARRAFGDVEALVAATGVLAAALAVLAGRIGDGRAVFACLIATALVAFLVAFSFARPLRPTCQVRRRPVAVSLTISGKLFQ